MHCRSPEIQCPIVEGWSVDSAAVCDCSRTTTVRGRGRGQKFGLGRMWASDCSLRESRRKSEKVGRLSWGLTVVARLQSEVGEI